MVIEYERTPVKRESDVEEVLFMFRDGEESLSSFLMDQDNQAKSNHTNYKLNVTRLKSHDRTKEEGERGKRTSTNKN